MITQATVKKQSKAAMKYLKKAGMVLTKPEQKAIEVADFGLNRVCEIGLQIVVYENNDRYCAKELILLPYQICPEHKHPSLDDQTPGKQETFRCRYGEVYLYLEGLPTRKPRARLPRDKRNTFTAWKEVRLRPGEQYTIPPDTLHWFQAGKNGAVVSEFSSPSHDESDFFTDPQIQRITQIQ